MTRRTVVTILIGILAAAILGGLWLWFFSGSGAPAPQSTGTFQQSGNSTTTAQTQQTTPTNIPGQVVGAGQTTSANTGGSINAVISGAPSVGISSSSAPNVNWLAGGSGPSATGLASGAGTPFTPSAINQLNNGQVGGSVSVLGQYGSPSVDSGSNNNGLAVGLIAGTAVACTAFLVQGQIGALGSLTTVPTNDTANNQKSFMDCLMRTIARAALQQLTNSIVNWINSGFNGSPSFVTNYQQFFASVADQAAGSFIANETNFAPFCTPFKNQIRIALAQSYARRGSIGQSCSLSQLIGTNLFTGKSTTGSNGWSNLLQFTTVPANNPYGSYMSAQAGLNSSILNGLTNAQRNMTPTGFLNFQQAYNCQNTANNGSGGASVTVTNQSLGYTCPQGCSCRTTTPGSVIESSLSKTLGVSQDYLTQAGISGSFDAILNALITQLTTKALYGGVSNLSGTTGYAGYYLTPDQQTAQAQGQYLLSNLQGLVTVAQQYGQSEQGSIQDIQSAQQGLNNLANCWQTIASSTTDTAKSNLTASDAAEALGTLHSYDAQIATLNAQITRANTAVALLQDLQTKTLNVGSTQDTAAVQSAFDADQAAGQLIAQSDLTQAQQDRTTLQSQLASVNQATAAQLQQCNATTI